MQEGDDLSCTVLGVPMRWRVAAIAGSEGLGAGQGVSLYLPLAHLRAALGPGPTGGQAEAINQIWIANRGDAVSSATRSDRVVEAVRPALVDPAAMGEVRRLLARPELRAALAARRGNLPERAQRSMAELLAEVDRPAPETGTLDRLLRSQSLRNTLIGAARDTRDAELVDALSTTLQRATGYQVQPLKQQILEIAERAGNVITTIFLLFSLLSIAAGLLLVFLIFSLLAASRRSELGIARALGTGRGHLIAMFTFEGVAYALLAALAGVPAGLLIEPPPAGLAGVGRARAARLRLRRSCRAGVPDRHLVRRPPQRRPGGVPGPAPDRAHRLRRRLAGDPGHHRHRHP